MDKFTSDLSNYKAVIDEMKQNSSSKEYEEFQANIFYNACLDQRFIPLVLHAGTPYGIHPTVICTFWESGLISLMRRPDQEMSIEETVTKFLNHNRDHPDIPDPISLFSMSKTIQKGVKILFDFAQ